MGRRALTVRLFASECCSVENTLITDHIDTASSKSQCRPWLAVSNVSVSDCQIADVCLACLLACDVLALNISTIHWQLAKRKHARALH